MVFTPRLNDAALTGAVLVRDNQSCLPLSRILAEGDLVLLLTPVVPPPPSTTGRPLTSDPFEPLGRALAKHHPWIRHVPYTAKGGITSTHVGFIKRAKAVVFVISGPPANGQTSQAEFSDIAQCIGEERPHVIVACCDPEELGPVQAEFPTLVQLPNYFPQELESAADLLFRPVGSSPHAGPNLQTLMLAPKQWAVKVWNPAQDPDYDQVYGLWCECMPKRFHLDRFVLQSLLRRDGYAMHFVVREPETREVLGFCATYTTYIGSEGESLVGSLAAIIVRPSSRQRGVGLSLHEHALRQLTKTRGVRRLQLGSTFPRLLFGLPIGTPSEEWFRRRGWRMDGQGPGAGQEVCDWLLQISDWPPGRFPATAGLVFRPCEFAEFNSVLDLVERESARNDKVGWYDEYTKLANSMNIRDIIVGVENGGIVAAALTYVKHADSLVEEDMPWARTAGADVGGVTCVCIADASPALSYKRDAIMVRLLDESVAALAEQGMQGMFIDAIPGGEEWFQAMGFKEWARYRHVWRKI